MTHGSSMAPVLAARREIQALFTEWVGDRPPGLPMVVVSGLGDLAERIRERKSLPFGQVPGLAGTTVPNHRGQLSIGDWMGKRVLVFEGRLHRYEGHPWRMVEQPVQI